MFKNLVGPLTAGIIFYFIYVVFELFVRRQERMKLIEKIGQNFTQKDFSLLKFNPLLPSLSKKSFTSLRFGCLFTGIGLGLLVGLFLSLFINTELNIGNSRWENETFYSVAYGSSVLFFGGLGLLVSYFIESKATKKENRSVHSSVHSDTVHSDTVHSDL